MKTIVKVQMTAIFIGLFIMVSGLFVSDFNIITKDAAFNIMVTGILVHVLGWTIFTVKNPYKESK